MDIDMNDAKDAIAIHELKGDTLRICIGERGATERPKEFKPSANVV